MAEGADMAARRGRDGDGMIEGLLELDLDRSRRRGAPEAVLTDAKTDEQVGAIAAEYARLHASGREDLGPVLFTRADRPRIDAILAALPDAHVDPAARLVAWPAAAADPSGGLVVIACAGTSDLPVAREAELTARYLGRPTRLIAAIGIADLHRLPTRLPPLRQPAFVIVAAQIARWAPPPAGCPAVLARPLTAGPPVPCLALARPCSARVLPLTRPCPASAPRSGEGRALPTMVRTGQPSAALRCA